MIETAICANAAFPVALVWCPLISWTKRILLFLDSLTEQVLGAAFEVSNTLGA